MTFSKQFLQLLVGLLFLEIICAQNTGQCKIDGITDIQYSLLRLNIDDNQTDTDVLSYQYSGTLVVGEITDANGGSGPDLTPFFEVKTDGSNFVIKTTAEMSNFDEKMPKSNADVSGTYNVQLTCDAGESTLKLLLKVADINEHPPDFQQDEFIYNVASPLMPPTDFTVYGEPITVTDLDFTNQNVVFTIEPDDFEITTTVNDKNYMAVFKAKEVISISDDITYTLTATDSGTNPGPLSSTRKITLKLDPALSFDTPYFTQSSYTFDYKFSDNSLTPQDGDITLKSNKLSSSITLTISDDYKDYFDIPTIDSTTGVVTLNPKKSLPQTLSVVALTLNALTDNQAVTSILINIPTFSVNFKQRLYTGSYDPVNKIVTLESNIEIEVQGETTETPTVTIEDGNGNFNITNVSEHEFKVLVVNELTVDELKKLPMTLKITAECQGETDEGYLIINSIVKLFKFEKPIYTSTYNFEKKLVEVEGEIKVQDGLGEVIVSVDQPYLTVTCTNEVCTVTNTEIATNILDFNSEISLTLMANDDFGNNAVAVLKISIQQGPRFNEIVYYGDYPKDGKGNITFNPDLAFENVEDPNTIAIGSDYEDNFEIIYNSDEKKWEIQISTPLTDETILNKRDLEIKMTAVIEGAVNQGESILILNLPPQEEEQEISFKNEFYTVEYPIEGTGQLNFEPTIDFNNANIADATVTINDTELTNDFEITIADGQWALNIKNPLTIDLINSNKELISVITATVNDKQCTATLIIKLPEIIGPKFTQLYWQGDYKIDEENSVKISLNNLIEVKGDNFNTPTIEDKFVDYFEIVTENPNQFDLKLKQNLVKIDGKEINIEVDVSDGFKSDKSVIVLTVIPEVAPEFSQRTYIAKYFKQNQTIVINNDITITNKNDIKNVQVTIEDNTNFNITLNEAEGIWELDVDTPLTSDETLTLTIQAQEEAMIIPNVGVATLVIEVLNDIATPSFAFDYYTGYYLVNSPDKDEISLKTSIKLTSNDVESATLTTDNVNFKATFNKETNEVLIEVVNNVEDIESGVTFEIKVEDSLGVGVTTVALKLLTTPKFSQPQYEIEYYNSTIKSDDLITITNKVDLTKIDVNIEEETYKDNFNVYLNDEKTGWNFEVIKFPDSVEYPLILTLKASQTGGPSSEATLILKVNSDVAPIFDRTYYTATVNNSTLTDSESISFTNKETKDIQLKLEDFNENFNLIYNNEEDAWDLNLQTEFTEDFIESNPILIVTITAEEANNVNKAEATLIVYLISPNQTIDDIYFTTPFYLATYVKDQSELELNQPIEVQSKSALNNLDLQLNPNDYFEVTQSAEVNQYQIEVIGDLTVDVLLQKTLTYTLTATANSKEVEATLIITLPVVEITFVKGVYTGTIDENGIKTEDIAIITDATGVAVDIDDSWEYKEVFTVTLTEKSVKISFNDVTKLPDNVNLISMPLIAKINNYDRQSSAVVNIEIIKATDTISFDELLYTGTYQNSTLTIEGIQINTDKPVSDLNIALSGDGASYFTNEALGDDKIIKLIVKDEVTLPKHGTVSLIVTASIKNTKLSASTVINIDIVNDEEPTIGYIKFTNLIAQGTYELKNEVPELHIDQIAIDTDQLDVIVSIVEAEYKDYFDVTYNDKLVTLKAKDAVPDVSDLALIVFTLKAENGDISDQSVVNLEILGQPDKVEISIESALYQGTYTQESGDFLADDIQIITERNPGDITINIDDGEGNGGLFSYEIGTDKILKITLKDPPISDEIINSHNYIPLLITATVTDTGATASTVLNIDLVKKGEDPVHYVNFLSVLNAGKYEEKDGKGVISDLTKIELSTDQDELDVEITSDDYKGYFLASFSGTDKVISLTTNGVVPNLDKLTTIVFTIKASLKDGSKSSETVVSLEVIGKSETVEISIDKVLDQGTYTQESGDFKADDIQIITERDFGDITINIDDGEGNAGLFSYDIGADKILKITLKNPPISDEIINSHNYIPLLITATVTDTGATASTVLNIDLVKKGEDPVHYVNFLSVLNTGKYEEKDGKGVISDLTKIELSTDQDELDVEITSDDYKGYFLASFSGTDKVISLTTNGVVPNLDKLTTIVFTIKASLKDGSKSSETVVSLEVIGKSETVEISIEKALYQGTYTQESGEFEADNIQIITERDPGDITINIDDGEGNGSLFSYEIDDNKILKITVKHSPINDEIINSHNYIPLLITATVTDTGATASTVLNIDLVKKGEDPVHYVTFLSILNTGKYEEKDGKGVISDLTKIELSTDQDELDVEITSDDYKDYFLASFSATDKVISLTTNGVVPNLDKLTTIVFTIKASLKDGSKSSETGFSLEVIGKSETVEISIEKALYQGTYTQESGDFQADDIQIITERDPGDITINIDDGEGNGSLFSYQIDDNKILKITLKDPPINDEIINSHNYIPLLITATVTDTGATASTVLNIDLVKKDEDPVHYVTFLSILNTGKYEEKDGKGVITDLTKIEMSTDQDELDVEITSDDYKGYFLASFSGTDKVISLTTNGVVPNLDKLTTIVFTIKASLKDGSKSSETVVSLEVIGKSETVEISIDKVLNQGTYTQESGDFQADDIQIITERDPGDITINIDDGEGNAGLFSYDIGADKILKITLKNPPISDEIINSHNYIPLLITATVTDTGATASTVLNIDLVKKGEDPVHYVNFLSVLNTGKYEEKDGKGVISDLTKIELSTDQDDLDVEITSDDYKGYFLASFSATDKVISLTTKDVVPNLDKLTTIVFTIKASLKDGSKSSETGVSLEVIGKSETVEISIDKALHQGTYTQESGDFKADDIQIITERDPGDITINIDDGEGNGSLFSYEIDDNKILKITLKDPPISEEIINSHNYIPLLITATVTDTGATASTVLNIDLVKKGEDPVHYVNFLSVLNTGKYEEKDGKGVISDLTKIELSTDQDELDVEITSDDYKGYFLASFSGTDKVISLTTNGVVPNLDKLTTIVFTIKASLKDGSKSSETVVSLEVIGKSETVEISIDKVLNQGTYTQESGDFQADDIQIITERDPGDITINIDDGEGNAGLFSYDIGADKILKITLKNPPISDEIINSHNYIPLLITATVTDTGATASTVLNIDLVKKGEDPVHYVNFLSVLNTGKYEEKDGKGVISDLTKIELSTDQDDLDVEITSDDYKGYFLASFSATDKVISLTTKDVVPNLDKLTTIVFTIKASLKDGSKSSETGVSLEVIGKSETVEISIDKALHQGTYTQESGDFKADDIQIITERDPGDITINIDDGEGNGSLFSYEIDDNKILKITLKDPPISEEIINSHNYIPLLITATVTDTGATASTVLNIDLVKKGEDPVHYVNFLSVLNTGKYEEKDGKGVISDLTKIELSTDQDELDVEITSDDYKGYFLASFSGTDKVISLTTNGVVPNLDKLTTIVFTIKASLKDGSKSSETVVSLEVIGKSETVEISIDKVLDQGTYTQESGDFKADDIQIITERDFGDITINIDDGEGNAGLFSYDIGADKILKITLKNPPISDEIINSHNYIPLLITATVTDTGATASTVLNIDLVKKGEDPVHYVNFLSVLNTGKYEEKDGKGVISDLTKIELSTDQDELDVEITSDDYKGYFLASFSGTDKVISLTTNGVVPNLDKLTTIVFTIKASLKDGSKSSETVVSLEVIGKSETVEISIEKALYQGTYTQESGEFEADNIQIITERDPGDITINIDDGEGNGSLFSYEIDDNKILKITVKHSPINDEIINSHNYIPLLITATVTDTGATASTVLNIDLVKKDEDPVHYVTFLSILNTGKYEEKDGKGVITDLTKIEMSTDQDELDVEITSDDYKDYFLASFSATDKVISVTTNGVVPNLDKLTTIVFTIKASLKDGSKSSETVVSLEVIGKSETVEISIDKVLHQGTYTQESGDFQADDIQIITERDSGDITINIDDGEGNAGLFSYDIGADKILKITLKNPPISEEIINSHNYIPLLITATVTDTGATASTVLNIDLVKKGEDPVHYVNFLSVLNTGKYEEKDGKGVISDLTKIELSTDQDELDVEITSDDYKGYFLASFSATDKVISLTTKDVVPNLDKLTTIVFTIKASLKDGSKSSETVVSLEIIQNNNDHVSLSFEQPLYNFEYFAKNASLLTEDIKILTDSSDEINIEITNTDNFNGYFKYELTNKVLTIELNENLPTNVTEYVTFIPLTVKASLTTVSANTIINVRLITSDDPVTGFINFPKIINEGDYKLVNDKPEFNLDKILLSTDQNDGDIDIKIIEDYSKNFDIILKDKTVTLTPSNPVNVTDLTVIIFTIEASIKNTALSTRTVVSLTVIAQSKDESQISFQNLIYTADYTDDDKFTVNQQIVIITSNTDDDIEAGIERNSYSQYFVASYSNNIYTITLANKIPENVLSNLAFITLTLTATIKESNVVTSAVLNVKLPFNNDNDDDGFDTTGYIAAISVLAVLLILVILAVIAFYYFKLRRKDYTDVDDDVWKVRFTGIEKNKKPKKGVTPVETRRPTGFVFNHLDEEKDDEEGTEDNAGISNENVYEDPDRKKSVIFDDNVEKLEIDKVQDEDPERRKSVIFDDKVEKLEIDKLQDEDLIC